MKQQNEGRSGVTLMKHVPNKFTGSLSIAITSKKQKINIRKVVKFMLISIMMAWRAKSIIIMIIII